jgi:hypothetical protein
MATNKCTSIAGHFNGHVEALKRYMWHCPMKHDQKPLDAAMRQLLAPYPPSSRRGDSKCVHFVDHFDGHCGAPVLYRAHCLMEEVHGFHKSH